MAHLDQRRPMLRQTSPSEVVISVGQELGSRGFATGLGALKAAKQAADKLAYVEEIHAKLLVELNECDWPRLHVRRYGWVAGEIAWRTYLDGDADVFLVRDAFRNWEIRRYERHLPPFARCRRCGLRVGGDFWRPRRLVAGSPMRWRCMQCSPPRGEFNAATMERAVGISLADVSASAELERDRIGELNRATKRAQPARGNLGGRAPFGFDYDAGELVPIPDQQETLRRIRELHVEGRSLRKISAELASRGVKLSHVTISKIIAGRHQPD
jgi:hypothetical protein